MLIDYHLYIVHNMFLLVYYYMVTVLCFYYSNLFNVILFDYSIITSAASTSSPPPIWPPGFPAWTRTCRSPQCRCRRSRALSAPAPGCRRRATRSLSKLIAPIWSQIHCSTASMHNCCSVLIWRILMRPCSTMSTVRD